MAFGKQPLTASQIRQFRAQADAELARRKGSPMPSIPALQPYIDEELAELEGRFGKDERLLAIATTLAIFDILRPESRANGEAIIEASAVVEKLDASDAFSEPAFAAWAAAVTARPPQGKRKTKASGALPPAAPFDRAFISALEMYLAFSLTNGRMRQTQTDPQTHPFAFLVLLEVAKRMDKALGTAKRPTGVRFERAVDTIVLDWVSNPQPLRKQYRPTGSLRTPVAFLGRLFAYDLDRERRVVGCEAVRPGWVRRQKRDGRLRCDEPLSPSAVRSARDEAERRRTHAPPAGFVSSTGLGERLRERQEAGLLAVTLANTKPGNAEYIDAGSALLDLDRLADVLEWLDEPASSRSALPSWAVAKAVRLKPRSVDGLVHRYEKERAKPFDRESRTILVPISEIDAIVAFANRRASTRRR